MLPHIVIVGSGFGGMAATRALRHAQARVTLIDKTNHHLFQPLLYQVATAALAPTDIATASRALLRDQPNVEVRMADVTGIDANRRCVRFSAHPELDYDFLVLATGVEYSFFGNPSWSRYTNVLKSIDDAAAIRTKLLDAFEEAEQSTAPERARRLLTFVIVGGGPTGVELAGAVGELTRTTLARDFKHINPATSRVVLFESGARLLAAFDQTLSDYAHESLTALGVEVRLNSKVSDITPQYIALGNERIETSNVFWCAGTQARPAASWLGVPSAHNGAVKVLDNCSVAGHPEIFVIGDVASHEDKQGRPLPGLAAVAKQQGQYVGRLLTSRLAGRPEGASFSYRDYGMLAVIGRSRAVAQIAGLRLKGRLAWLIWSLVHLLLLVDFRSRLSVYVNWTWAWFTYGRGARLLTGRENQSAPPGARSD